MIQYVVFIYLLISGNCRFSFNNHFFTSTEYVLYYVEWILSSTVILRAVMAKVYMLLMYPYSYSAMLVIVTFHRHTSQVGLLLASPLWKTTWLFLFHERKNEKSRSIRDQGPLSQMYGVFSKRKLVCSFDGQQRAIAMP